MTFKDDIRKKTGEFFTNSQEMFEKIFAQATRELKITRKPKSAIEKPLPAPQAKPTGTNKKKTEPPATHGKSVPTYKSSEKVKASPQSQPKPKASSRKGSRLLRTSLLLILSLVLAGFAANHFAIIDFSAIPDLLGLSPKPVVQAPIPRKQPAKPSETPVRPPSQPQTQETLPAPAPAPSTLTHPALSKEEKLVELETPTTITPPLADKEQVQANAPSAPAPDQPKPVEVTPRKDLSPVTVQTEVLEQPSVPTVAPSKPIAAQNPYSVYLGSFKAPDAVKKALSDYQEKGLSAYWVRVDLGDKGVWYRFFAGYFRTKQEAEKFIKERNLQGATPGFTKFANLIGAFASEKEAEDQKRAIASAGFYPYVIKDTDGKILLYSGAFDRKEYAEKGRSDLASKGIMSTVVER